jgi:hypothetical protein
MALDWIHMAVAAGEQERKRHPSGATKWRWTGAPEWRRFGTAAYLPLDGGGSIAMNVLKIAATTACLLTAGASIPASRAAPADYPTEALADYVFGCMASNGQTQDNLRRCSCSIDVVASIIPYDKYVQASTVLSLTQVPGDNTGVFRDAAWTKGVVEDLRRAQVEAELRCF